MDMIKSTDSKYEEYETLLLERDQLRKEAGQIWTEYIRTFGELITGRYEKMLECIKLKKSIAYYQNALNHGKVIDADAMKKYLESEMAQYYANLKQMLKDNATCRDAKRSSSYEVQRSKTLYRRLAKLIHPDTHPETDRQEVLLQLWQRIVTAYGHNDVKELSELEVLVRKALRELGEGKIRVEIPDLEEKIESLRKEIHEIPSAIPYTYGEFLTDEETIGKKKAELEKEISDYEEYRKELQAVIDGILQGGGVKIRWQMK